MTDPTQDPSTDASPMDAGRGSYILSRLRYFDGEYLTTADFADEQDYHVDRRVRHERLLHVSGILEGLKVSTVQAGENWQVAVSAGSALSKSGNQILLSTDVTKDFLDNVSNHYVEAVFVETATKASGSTTGNKRFAQDPQSAIVVTTTRHDDNVLLATVKFTNQVPSLDPTGVQYAGIGFPYQDGKQVSLRADSGALSLSGSAIHIAPAPGLLDYPQAARYASIQNESDTYNALMILGQRPADTSQPRLIKLWDAVEVCGSPASAARFRVYGPATIDAGLSVTGALPVAGDPNASAVLQATLPTTASGDVYSLKLEHNGSNLVVRPAASQGTTTVVENRAGALVLDAKKFDGTKPALYLDPSGNVGVGNTAPATALDVSGGLRVDFGTSSGGTAPSDLTSLYQDPSNTKLLQVWADGVCHLWVGSYGTVVNTSLLVNNRMTTNGALTVATGGLSVTGNVSVSSGQVGIGKTPSAPLDVNGNAAISGALTIGDGDLSFGKDAHRIDLKKGIVQMGGTVVKVNEVVGAVAFVGYGTPQIDGSHGQIAYRACSGFELVDISALGPDLDYDDWPNLNVTPKLAKPGYTALRASRVNVDLGTAVACPEAVRIVRGTVNDDGSIAAGSGFSVTKTDKGTYDITFDVAFGAAPCVVATQLSGGDTRDNAIASSVTATSFCIKTGDEGGNYSNRNFCFLAIGV